MVANFIREEFGDFNIDAEALDELDAVLRIVKVKKNENFIKAGQLNKCLGVILEGSMYALSVNELGEEVVEDFFYPKEQYFVFNYESYLKNKPINVTVRAAQDCLLLVGDIEQTKNLYAKYPKLYQMEVLIIQQHFVKALHRIKLLREQNTTAKIQILQNELPGIFHYFSFSHIASYLGVHRNTFCRAIKKM